MLDIGVLSIDWPDNLDGDDHPIEAYTHVVVVVLCLAGSAYAVVGINDTESTSTPTAEMPATQPVIEFDSKSGVGAVPTSEHLESRLAPDCSGVTSPTYGGYSFTVPAPGPQAVDGLSPGEFVTSPNVGLVYPWQAASVSETGRCG
jgi:hypothetical protein